MPGKATPKTPPPPQQPKAQRKVATPPSPKLIQKLELPECSMHYAAAIVNPFDADEGACIPAEIFPLPSCKQKNFIRGQLNLSTTGYGYIMYNPVLSNNQPCATFTTITSVGGGTTAFNAFTNTGTSNFDPITFANANLSANNVQGRIVSYGIRAKYIDSDMNRNGVIIAYEDPDHIDLAGYTHDALSKNQYSDAKRPSSLKDWDQTLCYSGPVTPSDVEFLNASQPLNNAANARIAILTIKGKAGDLYEWECYQHYEHIGSVVNGRTASHSEPEITGKTIAAAKTIATHKPLQPEDTPTFFSRVFDGVSEMMPQLIQGGRAVMNLVTGNIPGVLSEGMKFLQTPTGRALMGSNSGGNLMSGGSRMQVGKPRSYDETYAMLQKRLK